MDWNQYHQAAQERMDLFDQLPRKVREFMKHSIHVGSMIESDILELTMMSEDQALALLKSTEARLCKRFQFNQS